jgi:cysteine desulfurase
MEHSSSWLPWVFHEGRYRTNSRVTLQQALGGKTAELNRGVMETGMDSVLIYKTREDFSFDPADIERVFRQSSKSCEDGRVKAIVATAASNVTGYRPPLKKIAEIAHRYKAMLVVDACQLLQHERLDMQESGADFAVFSGHKMYAPFGCGVVVGDRRLFDAFWPYQMGGGNFPYITADGEVMRLKNNAAHEAGTPNFLGARAIHRAIDQLTEIGMAKIASYERLLVKYAFDELSRTAEITIYSNNFRTGEFDGSVITFNVGSLPPRLVAEVLDSEYGIGVRAGAYCAYEFARRINKVDAGEDREISRQVAAGNTSAVPGSVRASFSLVNSKEDVDRLVAALKEISKRALKQYKMMYAMDKRTGEWKGISR